MFRWWHPVLAVCLAGAASAQTLDAGDAALGTAQNLADLCSAEGEGPDAEKARIFCHGFLAGAMHFHAEIVEHGDFEPLACPQDAVTRRDMAQVFVAWAADRSDLLTMTPLEGAVRAAQAAWPCS